MRNRFESIFFFRKLNAFNIRKNNFVLARLSARMYEFGKKTEYIDSENQTVPK